MELLEAGGREREPGRVWLAPQRRAMIAVFLAGVVSTLAALGVLAELRADPPPAPVPAANPRRLVEADVGLRVTARGRPVDAFAIQGPVVTLPETPTAGQRAQKGVLTFRVTLDNRSAEPLIVRRLDITDLHVRLLAPAPRNPRFLPYGSSTNVIMQLQVDCSTLHGSPPDLRANVATLDGRETSLAVPVREDDPVFFAAAQDACG